MPSRADKGHRDSKSRRDWERVDWTSLKDLTEHDKHAEDRRVARAELMRRRRADRQGRGAA